ncbi:MAG: peptidoglycan bridge formation glycyltransferase FemA/FemB family protein [bacterium]|nr:peptidoglycan bridge formation glycyltransferase FemA/FemB family protein [bacterium]
MLLRPLREEEQSNYNKVVSHPLQSWEWGTFRAKTGLEVERIGFFEEGKLVKALQVTFHPIPILGGKAGYFPKGFMPDEEQLSALKQMAAQQNAVFIKLEPNIARKIEAPSAFEKIDQFLKDSNARAGRALFTKYTFQLDLTNSEDELFNQLTSKTRYNVNLAHKKGVQIIEDSSAEGMEQYISILQETTTRQGFYAHTPEYFRTMWQVLGSSGMMRIFHAVYDNQVVVSWIMFVFNGVLYYPYGASRSVHRDVMASNLMMWEMIRFGKAMECTLFDMWGSLGPQPSDKDPWFGFHRFKKGYGGDLVEFLGTYDLVTNNPMYSLFTIGESIRWKALRFKAKLRR